MEEHAVETGSAPDQHPPDGTERTIGTLLDRWQRSGDPDQLAVLVMAVRPLVEAVAVKVLRTRRIAAGSAVDDVVSLVLDHLRRLPGDNAAERRVTAFRHAGRATGSGIAYIRTLTRHRSLDVARGHRRRWRHALPCSAADDVRDGPGDGETEMLEATETRAQVAAAIGRLDPLPRAVIEMLLAGESQAAIAHALDVCEGTVSRMRKRAIDRLRALLDE